ncbi:MAG: 16S rRNA methyltransferase [Thermoplasmata archaeon HGW-Thermoplasmata-1]|nr:MAG: 16S rRNA methyltransferase [Thermoplasmata archaeon HGW-Thermoplasmata-1]
MLTLLLAESELELIPQKLTGHPSVVAAAKRTGKKASDMLLDASLHHSALNNFPDGQRRGRPDMVHFFLVTCLESILNKHGGLRVMIHTRNDELITVNPETRIPRGYSRFAGLIEQLFKNGAVPKEEPLMQIEKGVTAERALARALADTTIAFSPKAKQTRLADLFSKMATEEGFADKNVCCVIGGFPSGDFHSSVDSLCDKSISIHPDMLTIWTVAAEIVVNYENAVFV